MKFWDKMKQKAAEYEQIKKESEALKKKIAEQNKEMFRELEQNALKRREEERVELGEIAVRIYAEYEEDMVSYCKEMVRVDAFQAEKVAIFHYTLNDEQRVAFLKQFTEEEQAVIDEQFTNLKPYIANALKEVLQHIANDLYRRQLKQQNHLFWS